MPIWINIKTTYDTSISAKLLETRKPDKTPVTDEDRIDAIKYWMTRLIDDAYAIAKTGKPNPPKP